ncbi:MAG: hypothetical protein EHM64_00445 [Ignavibacteriae bacterium]|nr:MAG: hypothetical protein EHM64_00445 [Ignavibacteriota bacterium]
MKKRVYQTTAAIIFLSGIFPFLLFAQMANLHGTDTEFKKGLHAGNQFRTTFWNDGTWGCGIVASSNANVWAGEWPINSGHLYLVDGDTYVISEVNDNYDPVARKFLTGRGTLRHIQSTVKAANIQSSTGDKGPDQTTGAWWTFLPLPGFTNKQNDKIAMVKGGREWIEPVGVGTWPAYWPDIADPSNSHYSADGWAGQWNGYFGRNKFNADEESYFVADDYVKQEFPGFRPDTNDVSRGGLGIRMSVRGFQWSKGLVQDALFTVNDLTNIGTYQHNKVVFGYKIGNNVGDTKQGSEGGDGGSYNVSENLAWTWDADGVGHSSWGTEYGIHTGVFGACFLESPGNPYDAIDNDNDGLNGPGPTITVSMFQKKVLTATEPIALIDYTDIHYRRVITTLADTLARLGKTSLDTLSVSFGGFIHKFWAGDTLQEIGDNLFDDNLNGVIDENRGITNNNVTNYLYTGHKYINYITGDGANNLLIDERRDDGIDNNGNWNVLTDDVGADGLGPNDRGYPGPDKGETDGVPTHGEPRFDETDINESDMIGLTSFYLYPWGSSFNQWDDETFWRVFTPGTFITSPVGNVELSYGSGYFPLPPRHTERFSIGYIAAGAEPTGQDTSQLYRTKFNVAKAYDLNYNFAKAPDIPVVKAVAGDHKVTLFWDSGAEESVDPVSSDPGGKDFEGYKIYRSTDAGWTDATPITDGYGGVIFRKPEVQYDLANGIKGFAEVATQGVHFYLGNDTGLKHYWTDTNVTNGTTYYYAVTSYDHGDASAKIDPSECSKFIAVQASGEIQKGANVAVVKPEAPSAGYVPGNLKDSKFIAGPNNTTTATMGLSIFNQQLIKGNHTYRVTFADTLSPNKLDSTKSFTLVDMTSNDTLLLEHNAAGGVEGLPITDGFQLSFANNPGELKIDTSRSRWSSPTVRNFQFRNFTLSTNPPVKLIRGDFEIIFGDVGMDTSKPYLRLSTMLPAIPVNFTVMNTLTNKKVDFAFREVDRSNGSGKFTINKTGSLADQIIFLTPINPGSDTLIASWMVNLATTTTAVDSMMPGPGDILTVKLTRPFLDNDVFEFTMNAPDVNKEQAKIDLDKVRVVPNPYIITNVWEPRNTYSNGRGERQLHFTHLPSSCTIMIFTVNGQLVKTLTHNAPVDDGTEIWNMLSKDNLEISYGIYIYHVKADGVGEKTGKFIVLK